MDTILLTLDSRGVATIRLNRPDLHNALDDEIVSRLTDTLQEVGSDERVRVVILTGNGINFSAGHDMAWLQKMAGASPDEIAQQARLVTKLLHTLDTLPKPTIARVQGSAFGIGAGLIACCDIAYGVSEALFSFPDTRLGAIPASIAPFVLRTIGERAARRYFLSAERLNAGKAKRLGLLHQVVEDEELDSVIAMQVSNLLCNGPHAMQQAKRLIHDLAPLGTGSDAMTLAISRAAETRSSAEGREGMRSFIEKRKPDWLD
ncbi:enoyl-CoA hydratase-related protein [Craterilacuibacter sp.]|uniref:enoyl-CoA hydratase-related protein n=1 Tax=Craterilacuibacter sp. TaxID=2870909 RepID=UPI003F39DA33